jgi:O-antigen/teichoic acid export membrane protein
MINSTDTREQGMSPEGNKPNNEFTGSLHAVLVRDGLNYFLSKVVPGLMGFLSVLVFVRLLGVEQYGRYAVIFAFVMAWASGLAGWLSQGILRLHSRWRRPQDARNFMQAISIGTLLSLLAGVLVVGLAMPAFGIEKGWSLLIPLVLLCGLIAYTIATARFQAALQSTRVLHFEVVRSVFCFLIPALLLFPGRTRDYRLLLVGIAIGYPLPLLVSFIRRQDSLSDVPTSFLPRRLSTEQRKALADVWAFGWPVALWLLCQQGLLVSDRYFLQRFAGYSSAGVYASMYDVIVRSFSLMFMPVTLAIHPLVMNFWNTGKRAEALRAIRSGVLYQGLMFPPVAACLILIGPWLSRFVLGKVEPGATSIVLPLAVGGFLWQVCLLSHKPLEILCQTKRMLGGILLALAINVAGNWLLVPRYGIQASAYLTVASSAAYLLTVFVLTPMRELSSNPDSSYFKDHPEGALSRVTPS